MSPARWIRFAALFFCITPAFAQRVQTPPGPRHFLVLVDSSFSMVEDSPPPARRDDKRMALKQAEKELANLLFAKNWYRPGQDLISVVDYGFDSQGRPDSAYIRLKDAKLDTDYVRPRVLADSQLDEETFLGLLRPKFRTHLNILAWAMPMGMAAAAVPASKQVQETYLILLNDAQMNDGSIVLEKYTLGLHLGKTGRDNLQHAEKLFQDSVVLTDGQGQPGAYRQMPFGPANDQIVVTIFRAMSKPSLAAAEPYSRLKPLDDVGLNWRGGDAIQASFGVPKELRQSKGWIRLDGKVGHASAPIDLSNGGNATIPGLSADGSSQSGHLSLGVERTGTNPLLGRQTYDIVFDREVLIPESPYSSARLWRIVLFFAATFGLIAVAWAYYQWTVAKHFRLWLPDYTLPAPLPALAQDATSHFSNRVPRLNGEEAAWLELPHSMIRSLFYRSAVMQWDERLEVPGFVGSNEAPVTKLPRFVALVWSQRPSTGGEYDVVIQRPAGRRNHRLRATVRFLSTPLGNGPPSELP